MKKFIIGLICGLILGYLTSVLAMDYGIEYISNRVWNSTNNTLKVIGQ
jgi:hypothetical protein